MSARSPLALRPLSAAILLAISSPAFSASFTVEDGETETAQQTLNDNETGTIETGGTLSTSTTAIEASGDNITVNNSGSINVSGSLAHGIYSTGNNATINNSGIITTNINGTSGIRTFGDNDIVNNSGSITTNGNFTHGILNGGGRNVTISNSGNITVIGDSAFGISNLITATGTISFGISILNSGSINTSGSSGFGIYSQGSNATINNSGSITSSGLQARGIQSSGDNSTVNNSGSITTSGSSAYGIYSNASNATINNSGSIITSGSNSHGIYAQQNDATIINSGSITTSADYSHGIFSTDINAIIHNIGSISTSARESFGIYSSGDNSTVNNSGSITTTNDYAYGIYSSGSNTSINNGSIITSGSNSHGIYAQENDATIINSGSILTTGDPANGIRALGNNAIIYNLGSISVSGESYGISSSGDNANIFNAGSVSTADDYSYAIRSSGDDDNIVNTGNIFTAGFESEGIRSTGDNATINNSGIIQTDGGEANAIIVEGNNVTINNSGFLVANGIDSYAVFGRSGASNITLNILPGSQMLGGIDLGDTGDNDTANIYASGISGYLTMDNVENINVFGNGILIGNNTITDGQTTSTRAQVVTVDPTGESARSVALSGMTSSIHGVINQRMNHAAPLKPVQLASLELSDGMYFEEQRPVAWSQVFGGTMDRDATGSAMAYGYDHAGINFGYEWDISGHRVGVLGGLVRGKTESELASFETESDNYYVGAYANRKAYGLNITGSLLAGYGDNDNDRLVVDNLNGFETASADFSSWFISPGISIGSAFDIADRLEFRPSVSVNYSIAWLDSYTEKGTTNANLSVDDRKLQALTARAQLAAAYQLSDTSEFELRAGVNSRHTNDDDTKVGIAGSQFRFANAGDESVTGGFAGAALRVMNDNNFTLIADVEFGGNSDEDYAAGSLTLQYAF